MKKVIRLTESDLTRLVKKVMMEVSSVDSMESMDMDQATDLVNQKTGENLTPDEVDEIVSCVNPNAPIEVDTSSLPADQRSEAQQKINELHEKIKGASLRELMQVKREFKQFARKQRQDKRVQKEQALFTLGGMGSPAVLFGVSMSPAIGALAVMSLMGLVMFLIIRFLIPALTKNKSGSCGSNRNRPRPNSNFRYLF
jgi:precorrin isomerase